MRLTTTFLAAILSASTAHSGDVYKCVIDGRKVFQRVPCEGSLGTIKSSVKEKLEEQRIAAERRQREEQMRKSREQLDHWAREQKELLYRRLGYVVEDYYSPAPGYATIIVKVRRSMRLKCTVMYNGRYAGEGTFYFTPPATEITMNITPGTTPTRVDCDYN
jgi:hypothetical protein